jgi:hypothetical protein
MHTIEITDDQYDRITTLREELADRHADRYTSVTVPDSVAYLLDLAETVDDPDRTAEVGTVDNADAVGAGSADGTDSAGGLRSFPREELEAELTDRNRRHTDPEAASEMDLYEIAAEYEVSGRSGMTKGELVTAITETIERRYTDPLAPVDFDVPGLSPEDGGGVDDEREIGDDESDEANADESGGTSAGESDGQDEADRDGGSSDDDGQLNAMLSLLETHEDKWRPADGDARYEVDLPDGSIEAARTKDDVRAVLFKHY